MSIEVQIAALIAALEANTAALTGAAGAAAALTGAAAPEKAGKTTTKAPAKAAAAKPAHTIEQAQAALLKIKDEFSLDKAKEVLAMFGGIKMAEIKADQADAVFAAAEAKYAELSEDGGDGDGL
jgi:hypothetical protein